MTCLAEVCAAALKQAELGMAVGETFRKMGVAEAIVGSAEGSPEQFIQLHKLLAQ